MPPLTTNARQAVTAAVGRVATYRAPALRCMGEPAFRSSYELARVAIDTVARSGREIRQGRIAVDPFRKKTRHNDIASLKLPNVLADRFNNAGSIGKQDAARAARQPS